MNKGEENRNRRHQLRDQYRLAYDGLNGILFTEDPVGINFGENTDEYEPEVGTILPRLVSCTSVGDVRDVVSQEFTRWFNGSVVGPTDGYERIAQRIWDEVLPTLRP